MNKLAIGVSSAVSIVTMFAVATPALAWHPKGVIVKKVQNQTTKSVLADANTDKDAVAAKPGDLLDYVIEVRNDGAADSKGWNDMAKTVMTDTLPAGIELADNAAQRTITVDLGLIKPGQTVNKTYRVKVTATKDGVITNKACFTGNSTANDNPQQGCDTAVVKVTVPPVKPEEPKKPVPPVTPVTPVTPTPPATPVTVPTPVELPATGTNPFVIVSAVTVFGYIASTILRKRALHLQ